MVRGLVANREKIVYPVRVIIDKERKSVLWLSLLDLFLNVWQKAKAQSLIPVFIRALITSHTVEQKGSLLGKSDLCFILTTWSCKNSIDVLVDIDAGTATATATATGGIAPEPAIVPVPVSTAETKYFDVLGFVPREENIKALFNSSWWFEMGEMPSATMFSLFARAIVAEAETAIQKGVFMPSLARRSTQAFLSQYTDNSIHRGTLSVVDHDFFVGGLLSPSFSTKLQPIPAQEQRMEPNSVPESVNGSQRKRRR